MELEASGEVTMKGICSKLIEMRTFRIFGLFANLPYEYVELWIFDVGATRSFALPFCCIVVTCFDVMCD